MEGGHKSQAPKKEANQFHEPFRFGLRGLAEIFETFG